MATSLYHKEHTVLHVVFFTINFVLIYYSRLLFYCLGHTPVILYSYTILLSDCCLTAISVYWPQESRVLTRWARVYIHHLFRHELSVRWGVVLTADQYFFNRCPSPRLINFMMPLPKVYLVWQPSPQFHSEGILSVNTPFSFFYYLLMYSQVALWL